MVQSLDPIPAGERVEHYRSMAAALRRMAERSGSGECSGELEMLAASYETLALKVARIEAGLALSAA
jgi:hypothetical protein